MKTDREITIKTGDGLLRLTSHPYTVQRTKGFDTVKVRHSTSQGYNQDGATILGSNVQTRDLSISGQIHAETTADMEKLRLSLLDAFRPKADIVVTQEYGGVKKSITAKATQTPQIALTRVSTIQDYTVSLVAAMPYWEDYGDVITQIADVTGGMHFPLAHPTHFGVKRTSMIAVIKNESADEIGMMIRFIAHGKVTAPQLLNVYTRESIKIDCGMEENDVLTVTTGEKKTVTMRRNGEDENYIRYIDLKGGGYTFLTLLPGTNTLRASAEEGEDMLETQIVYKNRYAGV